MAAGGGGHRGTAADPGGGRDPNETERVGAHGSSYLDKSGAKVFEVPSHSEIGVEG